METVEKKIWLNKLNWICSTVLMPAMAVTFILFNTVVNLWLGERIATIQNILAIFILIIFIFNLLTNPKKMISIWVKQNVLVILYFVVRFISLWQSGFDYSVLRTIFFEVFFLIGLTNCTVGNENKNVLYVKLFVWLELVMTFFSFLIYYIMPYLGDLICKWLLVATYVEKCGNAMMFSNPNTAGLMAGFAIVVAIVCYGKSIFNNRFLVVYGMYNIIALILFGCRSADVAVATVIVMFVVANNLPHFRKRFLVNLTLLIMVFSIIPLYGFIHYQVEFKNDNNYYSLNQLEIKVNHLSTNRYAIWKEGYVAQKDNLLFGSGSLKLEKKDRESLIMGLDQTYYYNLDPYNYYRFTQALEFGPHNGYIAMLSCTGLLGLILFILILLQRVRRKENLEQGKVYLILVFVFVINCFESLFVLNRFFTCFYMFLILKNEFNIDENSRRSIPAN